MHCSNKLPHREAAVRKCFIKFRNIHKKRSVPESFFKESSRRRLQLY